MPATKKTKEPRPSPRKRAKPEPKVKKAAKVEKGAEAVTAAKTEPAAPAPKAVATSKEAKGLFDARVSLSFLGEVVCAYLANQRQGTKRAKTRGEVSGTTAKMYRQKGTGRARHGDARANIFVGGGKAFPPLPKSWRMDLPKKMRRQALLQALSLRHGENNVQIIDEIKMEKIKTKAMVEQLKKYKFDSGLIVLDQVDEKVYKSARNIPRVDLTTAAGLNALAVLAHARLLITKKGLEQLQKRLT